jgi:redox-sensitive bicupin YhaK (pirin superfamily)
MFYADVALGAGASVPLDPDYDERAIYTVSGDIEIAEDVCPGTANSSLFPSRNLSLSDTPELLGAPPASRTRWI